MEAEVSLEKRVQHCGVLRCWNLLQVRAGDQHPLVQVVTKTEHRGWGYGDGVGYDKWGRVVVGYGWGE